MVRAIKSARLAGLNVERVEVDVDGKIIVVTGKPETPADVAAQTAHYRKGKPWRILQGDG
jgi:HSP20 family molecular chaperone IbpA